MLDNIPYGVYNIIVTGARQERRNNKMEQQMKEGTIGMLVSIREHAEQNGEFKTVELINKILEEYRKK